MVCEYVRKLSLLGLKDVLKRLFEVEKGKEGPEGMDFFLQIYSLRLNWRDDCLFIATYETICPYIQRYMAILLTFHLPICLGGEWKEDLREEGPRRRGVLNWIKHAKH